MSLTPEQIDHINFLNWFKKEFPALKEDIHHFANERKCTIQQGRLLKRMGVTKGVADFFLALPCAGYHGLWIELKVGNGKLSPEQKQFLAKKTARGYMAVAVWGKEAAQAVTLTYLNRGC